ncbi:methyl-accepting chemotaxis protein [Oryzomicrobium terrae]|uniref:Methyl-accepting chemotaxis protein n=2 Tax=root TaxID=1 RepID=A0A5C1E5M1_9RHOO|nr:methyl-accepting chemotaxis protein [Oryzomicrobium terrae]QEL64226.1 methyl-accepting chemotaxis protein [Oryzomicrobium terrae]
MKTFWQLYDWVERTFWNTLTKKLMSFLLLFLLNLFYLGVYLYQQHAVEAALQSAAVAPEVLRGVSAAFDQGWWVMLAVTAVALVWNVLQIAYLRYLIVRPIRTTTQIFDEIGRGEGDFSRDLPVTTHDELRELSESYNRFADKMRQIISEVRKMSVNIAREAVVVRKSMGETAQGAVRQGEITEQVFDSSSEAIRAIQEVTASAELISRSTDTNLQSARGSLGEMLEIVGKVQGVSDKLMRFNDTVGNLSQRSDSIRQIAALIKEIADQTNLLALNAAIEAARAGEAGRGFAVVADEVRKLAERVNVATQEITQNINDMIGLVKETQVENEVINSDIGQTRAVVERSSEQFRGMVQDFEHTSDQLNQIAAAMEQLSATNAQVHGNVTQIHTLSADVSRHMSDSERSAVELMQATEGVQELVSRFKIGRGTFDYNVEQVRAFRDRIQAALEAMRQRGIDVFDRNYRAVAGTNPQKYRVAYDEDFMRDCQGLLDDALANIKGGAFAVAVDTNGYLTAHNAKFSNPLTGDYQTDLVGNRTRRKFESPTELRAARNTNPMLLQTYIRDTGELLCDIAMPVMVDGRHWGNVRVGCNSNVLLDA